MSTSSHPILLAALDLDGTLLNSNGEVSPYTQKVLSEASDRGVVVIPATGRPLASLPPVVAKQPDRKSTRLNSSHRLESRMPSSA